MAPTPAVAYDLRRLPFGLGVGGLRVIFCGTCARTTGFGCFFAAFLVISLTSMFGGQRRHPAQQGPAL